MKFVWTILIILSANAAFADVKIVKQNESKATLANGLSTRFVEMKKEITVPKIPGIVYHATDTRFIYKVPSPADIETYGVVQWIRGCQWEARQDAKGKVTNNFGIAREYFGQPAVIFRHAHWQIDNDTNDPIYSAYEGVSRFALLRWNDDPNSLDADNAHYYQSKKPTNPIVFVTDLPGAGNYDKDFKVAKQTTLEFKTCIFKVSDLPVTTTPDGAGVDQKKALWCASWDHKSVWNFKKARMEHPKTIDPFCATQP